MKETKEVIKSIVQQEMSNILAENQEIIKDVIKTSLLPELRAIIRNNIFAALEDLMEESAGAEKKLLSEKDNVTKESVSEKSPDSREPAQPSVTETPDTCCCNDHVHDPSPIEEDASISVHDESVNSSSPETTDADLGEGRYLYCLVEGSEKISLGKIGIEGNEVYTIPYRSLCAVVHDCPAEPYKSDDQEVMTNWVLTHQQVTDQAWEKFGSVLPLGFDTIIQQKEEISPDENTKKWLEEEYDSLKDKFEKIRGKAEYGIQIFWDTKVIAGLVSQESEEIKNMEEEMNTKPKGIAYMYKQKLESLLKTEMEEKADKCFKDFYERIRSRVDEVKIEKIKKDEEGRQMLMNFTCLLSKGKSEKLGDELETINNMEGFSVRFTGPWPPYGFV